MRTLKLTMAVVLLSIVAGLLTADNTICGVSADHGEHSTDPNNFCFQSQITITNNTASALVNKPVRVEIDTLDLIAAGQLNNQGWDFKPILGSISNSPNFMGQDINDSASGYWFLVDNLAAGESLTYSVLHGNTYQKFDNGFISNTYVNPLNVPHSSSIDLSGETSAEFDVIIDILDITARDNGIVDKLDGTSGYEIVLADVASVLNIRFTINDVNCDVAIANTGRQHWRWEYVAAAGVDVNVFRDGVNVGTCDTDETSIFGNSVDFNMANGLTDAVLNRVIISENVGIVGSYSFDVNDITETDDTSPTFAGTFLDATANNNDGTYSFSEDQTNISFAVNPPVINHLGNFPVVDTSNNRFDGIFAPGQITIQPTPSSDSIFKLIFSGTNDFSSSSGINPDAPRFAIAFGIGMLLMIPAVLFTRFIPLGLVLFISPVALGAASGWYNPIWAIIMVLALPIAWWGSTKALETSVS